VVAIDAFAECAVGIDRAYLAIQAIDIIEAFILLDRNHRRFSGRNNRRFSGRNHRRFGGRNHGRFGGRNHRRFGGRRIARINPLAFACTAVALLIQQAVIVGVAIDALAKRAFRIG